MEQSDGKMVGRWYHIWRWTDSCVQETQWDGGAECAGRSDGSGEWIEKLQEWKLYREYVKQGIETDVEWVDNVADRETVKVLQELLESEDSKDGENKKSTNTIRNSRA